MKKLLLILIILVAFGYNYGLLSLGNGYYTKYIESEDFADEVTDFSKIEKVKYYDNPAAELMDKDADKYVLIIATEDESFVMFADEATIAGLEALGVIMTNLKPEELKPLAYYIYAIALGIVLILPLGKKKK